MTNLNDRYTNVNVPESGNEENNTVVENTENDSNNTNSEENNSEQKKDETPEWFNKRINKITKKRREAESEVLNLRSELEKLKSEISGNKKEPVQKTEEQIRNEERDIYNFEKTTTKVADSIEKQFGKDAIGKFTDLLIEDAGLNFDKKEHRDIIKEISEYENPGHIYKLLSEDSDIADELFNTKDLRKQTKILLKLESKSSSSQKNNNALADNSISKAPEPTNTNLGKTTTSSKSIYDKNLSASEYAKMREEMRKNR